MPGEGAPLGARPDDDELALDVAQARIAAKLFGVAAEVALGRYRLLEVVGRGGMGVVWGAWDPELERKVAIKLVDPLRSTARDRIVAEARALAKLSHPNVVPIYDVGAVDDRVYLVMEWVAGDNLRTHLAGKHAVREIVDIYAQAARGLAAVHAAGFIHRDFKPENAIIGKDGRVRVLDFGLARADIDARAGEVAGTPRYMAPEQIAGAAPTPAVDQFALCVALREALEGRDGEGKAEVPRWLGRLIARGTAAEARDRFPTLDDLIRALGRDPARVLRRRLLATGVLALAATTVVLAVRRDAAAEPCAGIAAVPSGLSHETRDQIAGQLGKIGGVAATELPVLAHSLDEHEAHWHTASHAACLAHARGELTPALYERQLTCLARARASLVTAADLLAHATAVSFPNAQVAASALVDPELCARVNESLVPPPPPGTEAAVRAVETEIERARVLARAESPDAVRTAEQARIHAESTGYPPVIARALLIEGRARMNLRDDAATSPTLARAMQVAIAARDDVTAVEAFARHAWYAATDRQHVEGAAVIRAVADRLGTDGTFARLLLLNNLGGVAVMSNDRAAARRLYELAMRDWPPHGSEDDFELVVVPQNLALVIDNPGESRTLLARARAEIERTLGADHPRAIDIALSEVVFAPDLASARAIQDSACERLARLYPHLPNDRANCEYEAGWLADEAGDASAVVAHFTAARFGPDEPLRAAIAAAMVAPSPATARGLERAAAAVPTSPSPWVRASVADAYVAAARIWEAAHAPADALRSWTGALEVLRGLDVPVAARRLSRARRATHRDHE